VIRPPRRSVTRFFIPLIDVLILLFCIFLLMPYVKPADAETPDATTAGRPGFAQTATPPGDQAGNVADLNRKIEQLQHERDRLLEQRGQVLKQLAIRVLEIDPATGRLYYYDPERVEVVDQADAQALIDRERRRVAGRELYFLILFPRGPSGYPLQRQYEAYDKWFRDVPHGFDSPSGRPTEY
jgi:hypothetical protein